MVTLIRSLLQHATAETSRSTALAPLGWLVAMLLAATVGSKISGTTAWLTVALGVLTVVSVAGYLAAYLYFLLRNPDALRSETYTLSKLAIERGVFGDSVSGVFSPSDRKMLEAPAGESEGATEQ